MYTVTLSLEAAIYSFNFFGSVRYSQENAGRLANGKMISAHNKFLCTSLHNQLHIFGK